VIWVNIKSEQQYKSMKKRLEALTKQREEKRRKMEAEGLKEEHIKIALLCIDEMYYSTKYDVEEYERALSGNFDKETVSINQLGSYLIKLRIWKGLNQTELAERLGVSQEQVSKDENREYQGASIGKINRVLQALGVERITILTSQQYPPQYYEVMSAGQESSATKQAG
jgi:predicted XRE-type DNA-binding protein